MADHGDGGGSTGSDVIFFLLVILLIAALFFFSGAAKRANISSIFIPFPGTTGTSTFDVIGAPGVDFGNDFTHGDETTKAFEHTVTDTTGKTGLKTSYNSPYAGQVSISYITGGGTRAQDEYIVITASSANKKSVPISGWRFESAVTGASVYIGNATPVYYPNSGYASQQAIFLAPGEQAIISSGRSPIGVSFHVNKCSGYLSQFQTFTPSLYTTCPRPQDDFNAQADQALFRDNNCYDHISSLGNCRIELSPPLTLSPACREFIYDKITYQSCLSVHGHDADFSMNEWRVYLNRDFAIWRDRREAIALIDADSRVVDSKTY